MAEPTNQEKSGPSIPPSARAAIVNNALRELPAGATAQERHRAVDQARAAIRELDSDASEPQLLEAAKLAIAAVAEDVRRRLRQDYWRTHVADLLPAGADNEDKGKAKDIALETLEELPIAMSDSEVREEIREALDPICEGIKTDQRIDELIEYGRGCVITVLAELHRNDEITHEQWLDFGLQRKLEQRVVAGLDGGDYALEGSESSEDVKEIVEEILAEELDLDLEAPDKDED